MKIKRIIVLSMILLLVTSSICFAASTYWLDEHYWTTDQTTIDLWEDYLEAAEEAEYYQGLCQEDLDDLIELEDQLDADYYDLVMDSAMAIGYSYLFYNNPSYMVEALQSVISAAESIYTVYNSTIAVENATSKYNSHLNSLNTWVSRSKTRHATIVQYDNKWGTLHYAP